MPWPFLLPAGSSSSNSARFADGFVVEGSGNAVIIRSLADNAHLALQVIGKTLSVSVVRDGLLISTHLISPDRDRVRIDFSVGASLGSVEESYDRIDAVLDSKTADVDVPQLPALHAFFDRMRTSREVKDQIAPVARRFADVLRTSLTYGQYCAWAGKCCSRSHGLFVWCCASAVTCDWLDM
jgi:hypothetical protein